MRLIIVHHHFRPGGVRRVIELAAPHLVKELRPRIHQVLLLGGEEPGKSWFDGFQRSLTPVTVVCRIDRGFGYLAEQRSRPRRVFQRVRSFLESVLDESESASCLIWAHNQGLGRNPILTWELQRACRERRIRLMLHHHDWWFDNRWKRWAEMRRAGLRTTAQAARVVFALGSNVRHVAINRVDAAILARHLNQSTAWLPNPVERMEVPQAATTQRAREEIRKLTGEDSPFWLMPCRLLRRKNIAEALLLTRWLRPEAWLITTGDVTSAEERFYANRLSKAADQHQWRLQLGILGRYGETRLSLPGLLAACEAVLLTSLQEGFGLPCLEAAGAGRPLIVRSLPNIMPDLAEFGFRFFQAYQEVLIHRSLFDWSAEMKRQRSLCRRWRAELPAVARTLAGPPWLLQCDVASEAVPFSRLTLTAQIEVLSVEPETSWRRCLPLNPLLGPWRVLASQGRLRVTRWPSGTAAALGGAKYARRFSRILSSPSRRLSPGASSTAAQMEFMRQKLATENLYPLMWFPET